MRRVIFAVVAAAALSVAGLAVADNDGPQAIKSVGGTFTAAASPGTKTQTCTNADGSFTITSASYSGMASSSEPVLNGSITLRVRSIINTTKNLGTVDGMLRITPSSGRRTEAHFSAVYANGQLGGLATGNAQGPYSRLVANISAGFNPASGFTDGRLGGTTGGGAVAVDPGRCRTVKPVKPVKPVNENSEARGTISALSATSITLGGLTCNTTAGSALAAKLATLKLNARAEIHCSLVNGQNTLTAVSGEK